MIIVIISAFLFINAYMPLFGLLPIAGPWLSLWSIFCALFWLVPLMLKEGRWSFWAGVIWGLLVFSCHLSWSLMMLLHAGVGIKGILAWLISVVWMAVCSGLWLWSTGYSWLAATILYFVFLTRGSFFVCGVLEGYPLIHPLLPFAAVPELLWIVQWIGDVGAFALIIIFAQSVADALATYRLMYGVRALLCLMPFVVGPLIYEQKKPNVQGMTFVKPWWYGCKSPMFAGYRMVHDIGTSVSECSDNLHTVILPESTFCFDVEQYREFFDLWCEQAQGVDILFGGHRPMGHRRHQDQDHNQDYNPNVYFNSIFVLRDGALRHIYDKGHLMPFVERVPNLFNLLGLGDLFLKEPTKGKFDPLHQNDFILLGAHWYQIFVCSELFFESKCVSCDQVLLLWNESWLRCDWAKGQALLFIDYFSIKNDIAVVYASTQGRTNISD